MPSKRSYQLEKQARSLIREGYENFASGMSKKLGVDPRLDHLTGVYIRGAFRDSYSLFEWCRTISHVGQAKFFLREIRSGLPVSIALAGLGLYEVANLQLRFICECIYSFLYFRDHPRELELALKSADIWEHTRPRAVSRLLKKLPEYDNEVGLGLINKFDTVYESLCRYAHPRSPLLMGQRNYLTQIKLNKEMAKSYTASVKALCDSASGLFWLGCRSDYNRSGELVRFILRKAINGNRRKAIQAHLRRSKQAQ